MSTKDVIDQAEKGLEKMIEGRKNSKYHKNYIATHIVKDFLSSYTKDLLQSVVDTCCNDCKDSIQLRNVIKELQK